MAAEQKTQSVELVCVGEALVQFSAPPGERLATAATASLHTAGAEMNVAVAVSRLGHRSAFVGRLGGDPFGTRILARLREADVDVSEVHVDPDRPTGVYFKDYDGEHTEVYYYRSRSAAASMSVNDLGPWADRPVWYHLTGVLAALGPHCVSMLEDLFSRVAAAGGHISFDVNYRPGLWSSDDASTPLKRLAERASIVFVGRDEARVLWDVDGVAELRQLLPTARRLVVKDGGVAATSVGPRDTICVPPLDVRVVEPVGAGDAFAAGYLVATLRSMGEQTALRWGHVLASRALTTVADQVMPPPADVLYDVAVMNEQQWATGDILEHESFWSTY
jgi:2-dehydro-3-deoxygluconokinase